MPTYAYACTECGHRFDTVQAFSDPSLTECPECTGRLRKVFSPVGVVFKGSGFYRNDSRSSLKFSEKKESGTGAPPSSSESTSSTNGSKADTSSSTTGTTTPTKAAS